MKSIWLYDENEPTHFTIRQFLCALNILQATYTHVLSSDIVTLL